MKPILFAIAALTLAAPASAQTIFPALAASRYCDLRSMGVSRIDATDAAIRDSWSTQAPITVTYAGKAIDMNVLIMTKNISARCPQYLDR